MVTQLFALDRQNKTLTALAARPIADWGFSEPYDLETWLSSCQATLFNRKILWLARQDQPSHEQRLDLLGIDELGNLIVTELKRGQVTETAITQLFSYAAGYEQKKADELAKLYFEASQKSGPTSLVQKASSFSDAEARLSSHVGDSETNESQILLIVGEDFDPKTLEICDYLNRSTGEAKFSIELWKYAVHSAPKGTNANDLLFVLEQILPPPSVRQEIEQKREASKIGKYARDTRRNPIHGQLDRTHPK